VLLKIISKAVLYHISAVGIAHSEVATGLSAAREGPKAPKQKN